MEYRKIEEIEIENMNTSFSKRDTSNWLPSSRNEFPHNVHGTSYSRSCTPLQVCHHLVVDMCK